MFKYTGPHPIHIHSYSRYIDILYHWEVKLLGLFLFPLAMPKFMRSFNTCLAIGVIANVEFSLTISIETAKVIVHKVTVILGINKFPLIFPIS